MLGRWWIATAHSDIVLVRSAAEAPHGATPIDPAAAAWHVEEWLAHGGDAHARAALAQEIAAGAMLALPFGATGATREALATARAAITSALAARKILAYAYKPALVGTAPAPPPSERPPEAAAPKTELSWIAIEVVDDEGKPVPNVKYRIELPDFSTREGRTDAQGKYKLTGIEPGTCKISFPELDKEAWEPI
jgi:hypothetical protein